jgi:RNA polymerase sigma-70 factor (ECF subfamily)
MPDESRENEPGALDELVARAGTDRAAFGALFDRYYPRVVRYCLRRLPDRGSAEDVTSEVFLRVASHLREFAGRTESDFRRWLFRIATNGVNAHLRQTLRRRRLWTQAAQCGRFEDRNASPSTDYDRLDWPTAYAALRELDERDQAIVSLRFFADCSYDDIADIVGTSAGAVRTALSRAIAKLRGRFDTGQRARTDD